ncbi:MAG: alpha/beta fold hydrolase [Dehalococcoidia bacterium]|jgi:alpha/beta superfamily hydrolase|nr:alpha/beta fold hydrolase [Chloroflexota bacterium]MCK4242213.1 alpha/beta fold hydrolase [Dehalococcoidia bacterium]
MKERRFSLDVEDVSILGQAYIPEQKEACPTLFLCHGIPRGTRDANDPGYPLLARKFCDAGFLTLIFNFRGTGNSGGNFDILGWTRDLEAVIDYAYSMKEVDRKRIFLMGFSGGAAVSVYVAAKDLRVSYLATFACPVQFHGFEDPEKAKSLVQHFRTIGIIRDREFPPSLEQWLDGFRQVRPIDAITRISPRPLLIVHGAKDDVVEQGQAQALYNRAGEPKQMLMVQGAGHRLRLEEKAMAGALKWLRTQAFDRD